MCVTPGDIWFDVIIGCIWTEMMKRVFPRSSLPCCTDSTLRLQGEKGDRGLMVSTHYTDIHYSFTYSYTHEEILFYTQACALIPAYCVLLGSPTCLVKKEKVGSLEMRHFLRAGLEDSGFPVLEI